MVETKCIKDEQHWKYEAYKQRITVKQWRELLLNTEDAVIFQGRVCKLVAKDLGAGVYELSKEKISDG